MKTWKKLLSLVLVGALAFSFTACGNAKKSDSGSKGKEAFRTLDQIKKSGTINIGVFSDKNHLDMWMKTVSIRDMTFILQTV